MANQELIDRIVTKIGQGERRAKIKQDLLVEGWPEGDIDLAYSHIHKEALKQIPFVETVVTKIHEVETKTAALPPATHVAILGVCAAALIFFAVGMYMMFDPLSAGSSSRDVEREAAFKLLNQALGQYYNQQSAYPSKLSELVPKYLSALPLDPQTKHAYTYTVLRDGTYQLCANFETKPVVCSIPDTEVIPVPTTIVVTPVVEVPSVSSRSGKVLLNPH